MMIRIPGALGIPRAFHKQSNFWRENLGKKVHRFASETPWNDEFFEVEILANTENSSFQRVSEASLCTFLPRFSLLKFDRLRKALGMAKLPEIKDLTRPGLEHGTFCLQTDLLALTHSLTDRDRCTKMPIYLSLLCCVYKLQSHPYRWSPQL